MESLSPTPIAAELLGRLDRAADGCMHHFFTRDIVFSHIHFERFLDTLEEGKPFYVLVSFPPEPHKVHLGDLVPFILAKWFQDVLGAHAVIQLTDDGVFLQNRALDFGKVDALSSDLTRDILAVGFDPRRTFVFRNSEYMCRVYTRLCELERLASTAQAKALAGYTDSDNIGAIAYAPKRMLPAFSGAFPHIFGARAAQCVVLAEERDAALLGQCAAAARGLGEQPPAALFYRPLPALQGVDAAVSHAVDNTAVYLSDAAGRIRRKIFKNAFSGGRASVEEHQKYGADLSVDVSIRFLAFFLEDDARLAELRADYGAGRLLTGHLKAELIALLKALILAHNEAKAALVLEDVAAATDFPRGALRE